MAAPRSILPRLRQRAAYSLPEVIVVAAVAGIVSTSMLAMFIHGLNLYHFDSAKLLVNRDIRSFTSEMTDNATYANYFLIFPSFTQRSRTVSSGGTNVTVDASVNDGESGDMLVLVFKDPDDDRKVSRLIGYYRAPANPDDPQSEGPVRRFEQVLSPSSTASVWTLLPDVSTANTNEEVIELSRGTASGRLFYNFYDRSVMVKGEIIHRGGRQNSRYERATNTYNFTVSPRG